MENFADFASSNVKETAYDAKSGTLQVTFKSGGRYAYTGVTAKRWHDLKSSKSVGSFIASKIVPNCEVRKLGAKAK